MYEIYMSTEAIVDIATKMCYSTREVILYSTVIMKTCLPHWETHWFEQWKDKHIPNVQLLGQGSVAHGCVSAGTPEQITPPFAGGGLVHVWILSWDPVPHVTVQAPQSVHAEVEFQNNNERVYRQLFIW